MRDPVLLHPHLLILYFIVRFQGTIISMAPKLANEFKAQHGNCNTLGADCDQNEAHLVTPFTVGCFLVFSTTMAACAWLDRRKRRSQVAVKPNRDNLVLAAKHGFVGQSLDSQTSSTNLYAPTKLSTSSNGEIVKGLVKGTDGSACLPFILITPPSPPCSPTTSIGSCRSLLSASEAAEETGSSAGDCSNDSCVNGCPSLDLCCSDEDGGNFVVNEDGDESVNTSSFDRSCITVGDLVVVESACSEKHEESSIDLCYKQNNVKDLPEMDSKYNDKNKTVENDTAVSCENAVKDGFLNCHRELNISRDLNSAILTDIESSVSQSVLNISKSEDLTGVKVDKPNKEILPVTNDTQSSYPHKAMSLKPNSHESQVQTKHDTASNIVNKSKHLPDYTDVFSVEEFPMAEPSFLNPSPLQRGFSVPPRRNNLLKPSLSAPHNLRLNATINSHNQKLLPPYRQHQRGHGSSSQLIYHQTHHLQNVPEHEQKPSRPPVSTKAQGDSGCINVQPLSSVSAASSLDGLSTPGIQQNDTRQSSQLNKEISSSHKSEVFTHDSSILELSTSQNSSSNDKTCPRKSLSLDYEYDDDDFDLEPVAPRSRLSSMEPGTRKTDFKFRRPKKSF